MVRVRDAPAAVVALVLAVELKRTLWGHLSMPWGRAPRRRRLPHRRGVAHAETHEITNVTASSHHRTNHNTAATTRVHQPHHWGTQRNPQHPHAPLGGSVPQALFDSEQ